MEKQEQKDNTVRKRLKKAVVLFKPGEKKYLSPKELSKLDWFAIGIHVLGAIFVIGQNLILQKYHVRLLLFIFFSFLYIKLKFENTKKLPKKQTLLSALETNKIYRFYLCNFFILLYFCLVSLTSMVKINDSIIYQIISITYCLYYGLASLSNGFKIFGFSVTHTIILFILILIIGIPNTDWWIVYAGIFAVLNLAISNDTIDIFYPKFKRNRKIKRRIWYRKIRLNLGLITFYIFMRLTEKLGSLGETIITPWRKAIILLFQLTKTKMNPWAILIDTLMLGLYRIIIIIAVLIIFVVICGCCGYVYDDLKNWIKVRIEKFIDWICGIKN